MASTFRDYISQYSPRAIMHQGGSMKVNITYTNYRTENGTVKSLRYISVSFILLRQTTKKDQST